MEKDKKQGRCGGGVTFIVKISSQFVQDISTFCVCSLWTPRAPCSLLVSEVFLIWAFLQRSTFIVGRCCDICTKCELAYARTRPCRYPPSPPPRSLFRPICLPLVLPFQESGAPSAFLQCDSLCCSAGFVFSQVRTVCLGSKEV